MDLVPTNAEVMNALAPGDLRATSINESRSDDFEPRLRAESTFSLDEADDAVEAFAVLEIGHDKGPFAAHPSRVGIHLFQRRADMRREVDLVDDEKVRPGDTGTSL